MWGSARDPHCGHMLSCGACQRLAAWRVRCFIFETLRLGTAMVLSFFLVQVGGQLRPDDQQPQVQISEFFW